MLLLARQQTALGHHARNGVLKNSLVRSNRQGGLLPLRRTENESVATAESARAIVPTGSLRHCMIANAHPRFANARSIEEANDAGFIVRDSTGQALGEAHWST